MCFYRFVDLMLVLIFPVLEFGIILSGLSRKGPLTQMLFITWILMLQHVSMLINFRMTKYDFIVQNWALNNIKEKNHLLLNHI